jgi:hypothetical protein
MAAGLFLIAVLVFMVVRRGRQRAPLPQEGAD